MARLCRFFLSITLVFIGSVAHATVKYTYTGKYFQWGPRFVIKQPGRPCPFGCNVVGYIVTQGRLSPNLNKATIFPLSFSFTDDERSIHRIHRQIQYLWSAQTLMAPSLLGRLRSFSQQGQQDLSSLVLRKCPISALGSSNCTALGGSFDETISNTVSYVNGNYNVPGPGSPRSVLMNPLFKRPKPAL